MAAKEKEFVNGGWERLFEMRRKDFGMVTPDYENAWPTFKAI